jgi:hypothetical protein
MVGTYCHWHGRTDTDTLGSFFKVLGTIPDIPVLFSLCLKNVGTYYQTKPELQWPPPPNHATQQSKYYKYR